MNYARFWLDRRLTSTDKCAITPLSSPSSAAAKKKVPKARFTQAARTSSDNSEERTRGFPVT